MQVIQTIKQAFLSLVSSDSNAYPQGQATFSGKTTKFLRYSPYGLNSNPPLGSWVLLLSSHGHESSKIGLVSDFLNRKKPLAEGEVVLYNPLTGSYLYLKSDGTVEINGDVSALGDLSVAGDLAVTGDLTVTGDIAVTGNVSGAASGPVLMPNGAIIGGITFGVHAHDGVTVGSGTSGGPV